MPAQILTVDDLNKFKTELLEDIKKLLWQNGVHPVKDWLKSPQVRKMLGVSSNKLQTLRENGTLSFSKIGGVYYYEYEDILKMLQDNKYNSRNTGYK